MTRKGFLVGVKNENGAFQVASSTGHVSYGEACHPLVEGMDEDAHLSICRTAVWMYAEFTRPSCVELEAGGKTWRVSPM
jgi:hypothetical protein